MGSFFPFNVHILPSSGAFGFSGGMSHKKHNCASVVAERSWGVRTPNHLIIWMFFLTKYSMISSPRVSTSP